MRNLLLSILFLCFGTIISAQTWTQVASLPSNVSGRNHPVTFSLNGYGYLGTGYYQTNNTEFVMSDFLKYDPKANTWTKLDDFPGQSRGFSYGTTVGDTAYMGFGLSIGLDSNTQQPFAIFLDDLWAFNAASETWRQLKSCACEPRYHPAFVSTNDKIFVGLGRTRQSDMKDWWEYDIATDSWSRKPDFPGEQRHHPYFFSIDSLVYVGFGHGRSIYKDFYEYNPRTEKWRRISNLPAQGRVAGTQFSHRGKGYVLSGQGEDHRNLATGEFWQYDPLADDWTQLPAHPGTGRWAPGSFIIGDSLYFSTGFTQIDEKDMWMFELPGGPTASVQDEVMANRWHPNPTTGKLEITGIQEGTIEVYDLRGQLLKTCTISVGEIDLSGMQNGMYLLRGIGGDIVGQSFRVQVIH